MSILRQNQHNKKKNLYYILKFAAKETKHFITLHTVKNWLRSKVIKIQQNAAIETKSLGRE